MKYYEINEAAAKRAKQMYSFSDYVDGSETAEYRASVDSCYKIVEALPADLQEKGNILADRYAKKLADWYNKLFAINMRCPSIMIAGGSNFPVRKKEKQMAALDKHYALYNEIKEMPTKIQNLIRCDNVIKASDENALEKLKDKLEKLEKKQSKMKEINAHYRKYGTVLGCEGVSIEKAEALDLSIESGIYKVPFPAYELTNNNAKIKSTKARITRLERLKASEPKVYTSNLFKVVENTDIMRLQLIFDDKPNESIRKLLKENAFKWSPKNEAWQRQLTENAKYSLKKIIKELGANNETTRNEN